MGFRNVPATKKPKSRDGDLIVSETADGDLVSAGIGPIMNEVK